MPTNLLQLPKPVNSMEVPFYSNETFVTVKKNLCNFPAHVFPNSLLPLIQTFILNYGQNRELRQDLDPKPFLPSFFPMVMFSTSVMVIFSTLAK